MHPANAPCLTAAKIDCCSLANNHVLDWGREGLTETLAILRSMGIRAAGAGLDREQAFAPAILPAPGGRILVFAVGVCDSGIPRDWEASDARPGIALLPDLSSDAIDELRRRVGRVKQPGDIVLLSIHWGGNWGYGISPDHREFAHSALDVAGVDLIHGHSSHHPKGLEVHNGKLILYGCGDFLNDYEGIAGYEEFRGDLTLMYWPMLDSSTGSLMRLEMTPLRVRRFRLEHALPHEAQWLCSTLNRASQPLASRVSVEAPNRFRLVVPEMH
jgi:poly-gamma-glutamate synthesis protein (capsule biosynthesis protein)